MVKIDNLERFLLSEYASNHAFPTKGGNSGKSHIKKWASGAQKTDFAFVFLKIG